MKDNYLIAIIWISVLTVVGIAFFGESESEKLARIEIEETNVPQIPKPHYEIYTAYDIFYIVDQGYEIEIWSENVGLVVAYKEVEDIFRFLERNSHRDDHKYMK